MQLVDVPSAATWAGVSDQTIRNWVKRGILKGYRIGPHLIRIDADELHSLLTEVVA